MAIDLNAYPGYRGWDPVAAEYDFRATGGVGKAAAPSASAGQSTATQDPVALAQKLRDFTVQANQPAIQTYQASIDPLKQRYSDLLTSIKGQQSVAENAQTRATSSALGARGLLPGSPEGQSEIAGGLAPIAANYQNLSAQTGLGEQQDINNINSAIAALEAGNPAGNVTAATGLAGYQAQAAATLAAAQAQAEATKAAAMRPFEVQPGNNIYNPSTNQFTNNTSGANSNYTMINGVPYVNVPGNSNNTGNYLNSPYSGILGYLGQ